jgi:hypothetical protein
MEFDAPSMGRDVTCGWHVRVRLAGDRSACHSCESHRNMRTDSHDGLCRGQGRHSSAQHSRHYRVVSVVRKPHGRGPERVAPGERGEALLRLQQ